jgi:hypothetical protein
MTPGTRKQRVKRSAQACIPNTERRVGRRQDMEWVYGLTGQAGSYMYMSPEVS